jgi:hypothetical protein
MLHYVEIGKGGCGVRLGFSSAKQRRVLKQKGHVVTMLHCVEIGKGACGCSNKRVMS